MSLGKETEHARALLGRGLLSHLSDILRWSAGLTGLLAVAAYFSSPSTFEASDVWFTFGTVFVMCAVITFFGLLLAAGRHRRRAGRK
jgi:hypothetical protein